MCFLFLQEPTNKFDFLAQKKVYAMMKEFKYAPHHANLQQMPYTSFLKDFLHPCVITKDFFNKIFSC